MVIKEGDIIQSRYRLVSLKGRGAFGEVWLAKDEQTDLDVAVKVYIALDDRGLEEFKAEYKNSYSLNHPNLLHAYHFDVVDRQPFLVMPYCPDSAESLVGNADEKTLLRFIRDVASGLEFLHSKDIIHRDIKPDNVLINQDGNFVITDFGVSSKMKSTLRRNSTRAMSGNDIAGTIGYMAPELFSRTPDAVKATDIWALGATVFEMATGELPFMGKGGVMLLGGASVPEMNGAYSEEFKNLVNRCLEKETWNRPTASKLVSWSEALLNGRSIPELCEVKVVERETSLNETVRIIQPPVAPAPSPSSQPKKRNFGIWIGLLMALVVVGIVLSTIPKKDGSSGNKVQSKPVTTTIQQAKDTKQEEKPAVAETKEKAKEQTVPQPAVDERKTKLQTALKNGDYATVKTLADGGYAQASLELAKHYLKDATKHGLAEKYANKAKSAGLKKGAQEVLDALEAMGYFD